jgi:hypothetical protein
MAADRMTVTFSGYPTHATEPSALPPDLFLGLQTFATAVTGALIFPPFASRAIGILVEGHADRDPQGAQFESKISLDRAINCRTLLQSQINQQAALMFMDGNQLKRLSFSVAAWGATKPVIVNPVSEEERKANRRVDVTYILGEAQAPTDHADSARRALALIQNERENGPIRRLKCTLVKIRDMPDVIDGYPDFDAAHRLPGTGGFPNWTPDQWPVAIKSMMVHVAPQVTSVMKNVGADQQRAGLLAIDDNVGRNIFNWTSQLNAGAATGLFDSAVVAFMQNLMTNNRAILSCYAGYSRAHHND